MADRSQYQKKHVETLKKEIQRLCDLGVLKWQEGSEWASPTFIIPKKDNTVRVISDFREVNKRIVRKPFPLPKISTVLQELEGFTYATALDLNMGYYTIRLDPDASNICTIVLPWGKYSYLRLPMGVACSPEIFQAVFYIYGRFWSLSAKWSPKNGLYNIFYGRLENTNKILNVIIAYYFIHVCIF